MINTTALINRLSLFLAPSGGLDCPLAIDVAEWARGRNAHRLGLVAGKQSCLEGWRQLAEVGMRMLHFLSRTSPDTLSLGGAATTTTVNRYLYGSSMSLINPLLREVGSFLLFDLLTAHSLLTSLLTYFRSPLRKLPLQCSKCLQVGAASA